MTREEFESATWPFGVVSLRDETFETVVALYGGDERSLGNVVGHKVEIFTVATVPVVEFESGGRVTVGDLLSNYRLATDVDVIEFVETLTLTCGDRLVTWYGCAQERGAHE